MAKKERLDVHTTIYTSSAFQKRVTKIMDRMGATNRSEVLRQMMVNGAQSMERKLTKEGR